MRLFHIDKPGSTFLERAGRCFRTGPDGRIPLVGDWTVVLREARHAGRLALQTRHGSARLVGFTGMPEIDLRPGAERGFIRDEKGSLHCCFSRWSHAWGWLRECECCGSPGRIQIHNAAGAEFLQVAAPSRGDALLWSDYLGKLVGTPARSDRPDVEDDQELFTLPRLVSANLRLPFDPEALYLILHAFGEECLPVRFTLRTAEVAHRRDIVPHTVFMDEMMLHAGESGASVQLALESVAELALTADVDGYALHAVDANDAVVISLSAAAHPVGAATWRGALEAAFPGLR